MIINQLRNLLGDGVTDSLIRSANQLKTGVVEAGDHYANTFKNTLKDTPDNLFRQSDELVNESNLAVRDAMETDDLYKRYIYEMKLPDDVSQAAGRAFHKTGVDDNLLNISLKGNPDEYINALRLIKLNFKSLHFLCCLTCCIHCCSCFLITDVRFCFI